MKKIVYNIHHLLERQNFAILILGFIIVSYLLSLFFSFLMQCFSAGNLATTGATFTSLTNEILTMCLLAPLVETLIVQYGIIETLRTKVSLKIACFISAVIFALIHSYNIYYVVFTFFSGLCFAYLYCLKKSVITGLLLTLTAHVLYNTLVSILHHI